MFSSKGTFPAVGLFSTAHIITIIGCFGFIALCVFLTRKMKKETYFKLLKIFAILLSCIEIFKMIWCWAHGYVSVNNWVPLWFCSIFIYSLWFTWSKNQFIKNLGLAYIAMAGFICGSVFIISPSTSFNTYPLFHFQCIYSMLYHSIMVYSGIMLFVTDVFKIDLKTVRNYCEFCLIFMAFAIIINLTENGNLMFIMDPSGIPLPFLFSIYNFSKPIYSLIIILAHLSLGFIVLGINRLIIFINNKQKAKKATTKSVEQKEDTVENKISITEPLDDTDDDYERKEI